MKSIDELREESNGHTRLLYHLDYWDGPHSGVMLWDGERAYFSSYGDYEITKIPFDKNDIKEWKQICKKEGWEFKDSDLFDYESTRYFKVYRIPKHNMKAIDKKHELFRMYVGTHTDYDSRGVRDSGAVVGNNGEIGNLGGLMPYDQHDKFYKKKSIFSFLSFLIPNRSKLNLKKCEVIGEFKI